MPAEAGIQGHPVMPANRFWIPAFAGMTRVESKNAPPPQFIRHGLREATPPFQAFTGKTGTGDSNEDSRRHQQAGKKTPEIILFVHQRTQPQGNRAAPEKRYGGCLLLF